MQEVLFWLGAFLGHGALWVSVVNRLHGVGWRRSLIDALTLGCGMAVVGIPLIVAAVFLVSGPPSGVLLWYGWTSLAVFVGTMVARVAAPWDPWRDRRSVLESVDAIDLTEPRVSDSDAINRVAHWPINQLLHLHAEHRTLQLDRLPESCEGLKIAHLTDLHMSGRVHMDYYRRVVEIVNDWSPDLVCVTGDIVEYPAQLDWVEPTLGRLNKPKLGAWFVLGNHDKKKIDPDQVRSRLEDCGLRDAASAPTTIAEAGVTLCGDEQPWFGGPPPLTGEESFTLCLSHSPDRFGWASENSVDLMLAGHCHGGQVCFPLIGPLLCPSVHSVRLASGTFRRRGSVLHVSRGTGSFFPVRMLCPPELALLTLTGGKNG